MPKGNSTFNDSWLNNPEYSWLLKVPHDKYSAKCALCSKKFSVASHGKWALDSHARGDGHKDLVAAQIKSNTGAQTIVGFLSPKASPAPASAPATPEQSSPVTPNVTPSGNASVLWSVLWSVKFSS